MAQVNSLISICISRRHRKGIRLSAIFTCLHYYFVTPTLYDQGSRVSPPGDMWQGFRPELPYVGSVIPLGHSALKILLMKRVNFSFLSSMSSLGAVGTNTPPSASLKECCFEALVDLLSSSPHSAFRWRVAESSLWRAHKRWRKEAYVLPTLLWHQRPSLLDFGKAKTKKYT